MNELEIHGLTKEQVEMLDYMWNELDTADEYIAWVDSLDERRKEMAEVLMRLVILELYEDKLEENDMTDAKNLLQRFTVH